MVLLALVSFASAAPGAIDPVKLHDQLIARFEDTSGQGGCLTELVMDLKANWGLFSAPERERITSVLAPFKADLVEPMAPDGAVPPPSGTPTDTCFGQQGDNRLTGEHFAVEWDTGSVTQSVAQSFLEDLEYAHQAEIDEQGWRAEAGDSQYLMLAFIDDQNTGGAYTTVEACHNVYAPYIVAGKDAVQYGSWTEEMAAHEFNHALQFNYSFAPEFWWWEATATYVQSVVRDSHNWADYLVGYSDKPYIALGASSQSDQDVFWHMYGLSIFGHYLADYQGGEDTVRATWENARSDRGQYDYGGKDMVEGLGLDWRTTWIDFITKNVAMDYSQHQLYPDIKTVDKVSSLPASGEGSGDKRPQGYGQNYIRFEGGNGAGDLHVTFSGDSSVDWAVILAESDGTHVVSSVSAISSGGAADLTFADFGEDDVYLVVSPLDAAETKHDYSWTAELKSSGHPPDTGTIGDDSGDSGSPGDRYQSRKNQDEAGCGCSSPVGAPVGLGWLIGLAGLAVRRRK